MAEGKQQEARDAVVAAVEELVRVTADDAYEAGHAAALAETAEETSG